MMFRTEKDTMGDVKVPVDKLWGAQTERSRNNFKIGNVASMPIDIIYGFAYLKKAAAFTNCQLGVLSTEKRDLIAQVCDEILTAKHDDQFPLVIWQTGSGTQINMNFNEVIANKSNLLLGSKLPSNKPLHPNDDINKSQSSNDTIPTAMHVATLIALNEKLLPEIKAIKMSIVNKTKEFKGIIKIGRTHLQDATPLSLGQEFSGYQVQLKKCIERIEYALKELSLKNI